jgi:hypothetical protein
MKFSFTYILLISLLISCNINQRSKNDEEKQPIINTPNPEFIYRFRILDSVSRANPNDTIYYCSWPLIKFMEINTGIDANSDGTQLGKLYFCKGDLQKWQKWFDEKYKTTSNKTIF